MNSTLEELKGFWPTLLETVRTLGNYEDIPKSIDWLERVLKETVPSGKLVRAQAFLKTYRHLVTKRSPEQDRVSYVIAWCIEIMQTAYLIADDIMDGSETRRGEPCWYRNPDVGMIAVNDTLLLENLLYQLINDVVKDTSTKTQIIHMFLDTTFKTTLGQALDTRMSTAKNYSEFTLKVYNGIVKYKTSYYTFYQPLALALILAHKSLSGHLTPVERVALKLGNLFQAQDDYIDCFADPALSGKIGTDIVDGKCTWLAAKALELATDQQKKTFVEYYGVKGSNAEGIIKGIYNEMKIPEVFEEFKIAAYKDVLEAIETLATDVPKEPFIAILELIYNREK